MGYMQAKQRRWRKLKVALVVLVLLCQPHHLRDDTDLGRPSQRYGP